MTDINDEFYTIKESGLYWIGWQPNAIDGWICVITQFICCLWALILVIQYIRIFILDKEPGCCTSKTTNHRRTVTLDNMPTSNKCDRLEYYLALSVILTFIVTYLNLYISTLSILLFGNRFKHHCFYRGLANLGIIIQRNVGFLFFLKRLKIVFEKSIYAVSTTKLVTLCTFYTIISISLYLFNLFLSYEFNDFRCDISQNLLLQIGLISIGSFDILFAVIIAYMFMFRLKKLTEMTHMQEFEAVMKKLTLLSIIMIISTLIVVVFLAGIFSRWTYQAYCGDLIINTLCIQLSFFKVQQQYYKTCRLCIYIQNICCCTTKIRSSNTRSQSTVSTPDTVSKALETNISMATSIN